MRELSEACPRYHTCAVNNCPLYSAYPILPVNGLDTERVCRLSKTARLKVVLMHPDLAATLQYGGMTPREFHAAQRMAALSEAERESMRERGRQNIQHAIRARQGRTPEGKKRVPGQTVPGVGTRG